MTATYGFKIPDNKLIAYAPTEVFIQEEKTAVATIKPSHIVMRVTDDTKVTLADGVTAPPLGIAGYEQSFLGSSSLTGNRPTAITTAYASGARLPVMAGTNFVTRAYLTANVSVTKGDLLATWTGGEVIPVMRVDGKLAIKIPFTKNTSEADTGVDLPASMYVSDCKVLVTTNVASSTIDVGLLSTESGGDLDGFLDGESCAAAGIPAHINVDATAANNTLGVLLVEDDIKSADGTALYYSVPTRHKGDGTATSIAYVTSSHSIAGYILLFVDSAGFEIVGRAEMSLASSTSAQILLMRATI